MFVLATCTEFVCACVRVYSRCATLVVGILPVVVSLLLFAAVVQPLGVSYLACVGMILFSAHTVPSYKTIHSGPQTAAVPDFSTVYPSLS